MPPTIAVNDPQIIPKIEAYASAQSPNGADPNTNAPVPFARKLFTPAQQEQNPLDITDNQLMWENFDEMIDQEVNRVNQRRFWDLDFQLNQAFGNRGTGIMPHMPQWRTFLLEKAVLWWKKVETDDANFNAQDEGDHSAFIFDLGTYPAPQIGAAPAPPDIDFAADPIGPTRGPGYWAGTPQSQFFPDGYIYADPLGRSPTGQMIHKMVVEPMGVFDYWKVYVPTTRQVQASTAIQGASATLAPPTTK